MLLSMRTTVRLDDHLLRQTKEYAAHTRRTVKAVIEDALREMFTRQQNMDQNRRVNLTVVSDQGQQAGVDLDISAALIDLMNGS